MIVHFRRDTSPWTLCGSIEAPHYVEGGKDAESLWRWLAEKGEDCACEVCLRRLNDPTQFVEMPTFEFSEIGCRRCEELENHIEAVPIAVRIDHGVRGEGDTVVWMRCVRCGSTNPCSEDTALDYWAVESDRLREEAHERSQGL